MKPSSLAAAREFLKNRRIALVGISRNERDFSRAVFDELISRGYDVVPVNLAMVEVNGRNCFARLQDVKPPVQAALLMTPPSQTDRVVQDCIAAGVSKVWMHRGIGHGSATASALARCEASGLEAIHDLCPFMALPDIGLMHRLHRELRGAEG